MNARPRSWSFRFSAMSLQFGQQRFRRLQIRPSEPFGESRVDRGQQFARLGAAACPGHQSRQAHGARSSSGRQDCVVASASASRNVCSAAARIVARSAPARLRRAGERRPARKNDWHASASRRLPAQSSLRRHRLSPHRQFSFGATPAETRHEARIVGLLGRVPHLSRCRFRCLPPSPPASRGKNAASESCQGNLLRSASGYSSSCDHAALSGIPNQHHREAAALQAHAQSKRRDPARGHRRSICHAMS